jgi:hypothetical protein
MVRWKKFSGSKMGMQDLSIYDVAFIGKFEVKLPGRVLDLQSWRDEIDIYSTVTVTRTLTSPLTELPRYRIS